MRMILLCLISISAGLSIHAQNIAWDDTTLKSWPAGFNKTAIESSYDHSLQPCIAHKTSLSKPQPLIVSLHTWSGDYLQQDSLSYQVAELDWNYIHPDFRGANNKPSAMGSEAVIKDIDDAIQFAIRNMNVDTSEVHIVGVSGGGYAAMLCYMKLRYPVKSFSSWVGISDIRAWYEESLGRKANYAADILKSAGRSGELDTIEVRKRSPLYMDIPDRKGKLFLYTGIHDGYLGSVPITQTLRLYNRIVKQLYPGEVKLPVSNDEMVDLVVKQWSPGAGRTIAGRTVYCFRNSEKISLCVFEGKHERIETVAIPLLPLYNKEPNRQLQVLTLGDSNGALPDGWPQQLRYQLSYSKIINISRSGKTIGFDNNGDTLLNLSRTLKTDLDSAVRQSGDQPINFVVIGLGTNDAKAVFDKKQTEVTANLEKLIRQLKDNNYPVLQNAQLVIVCPPPYGKLADQQEKYKGGNERVKKMSLLFKQIAVKHKVLFVDAFHSLESNIDDLSKDGIHLNAAGQRMIARLIAEQL